MLENFPHFAVFVLVAHATGLANDQTALVLCGGVRKQTRMKAANFRKLLAEE